MEITNPYHSRYQFIQIIGKGNYGIVFKVKDTKQNNFKAQKKIKIIDKEQKLMKSEVELLKKLNHQNIIRIYDSYIDQEVEKRTKYVQKYFHILMQFVEGDKLVDRLGKVDEKLFMHIYDQLKDVFQYLESKNIIHRDIKLDNIMITNDNKIKLIDFGIACQLKSLNTIITKQARGHYYYKAPQINMDSKASKKSDLWSVGIILIQLCMGKLIEKIYDENQIVGLPNTKPGELIKFLKSSNIKKQILKLILPLLEEDYHKRQFYLCLNLNNQKLKYAIFKQKILKYRNLNQLNISNCNLNDDSLKLVSITCKQLTVLNTSGNQLTNKSIMYLKQNKILPNLIELNVAFTNITDDSLFQIIKYGRFLQSLDISYTRVTQKSIITISQLKQLSSLAIWSGEDYYPSSYNEHLYLNFGINLDKCIFNKINITKECIKQISKLRLKQLTINLKQNSADEIMNRMEQDSSCIEVKGKLSKQNINKIVGMKELKRLYLNGVKDYVLKELKSKKLESIGLVNSNIVIKELVNYLSNCEQLRDLNLRNNNIGDQGATAIANRLTNLTTLDLRDNNIGVQGATAIANRLTNLTTLDLWNNNIGDQGATAIANRLTNLTTLDLSSNNIGVQGATAIANRLTNLTTLDLYNNKIGVQGATAIANRLTNLTTLDLWNNNIGDQGATAIANRLTNLTTLYLGNNNIGDQGATAIANRLTNLTTLYLGNNNIGVQGATAIANRLTNLTTLDLWNNNIGDQGATAIANRLTNLTTLDLWNNNIGDQGATAIANRLTNLKTLDLSSNNIGVQGATAIANRLTNLTTLDLYNNKIGVQGATAIANRLTNLTTLDLWNNNIGDQGATAIANRLTNLTTLYLGNNNIGDQGATAIANRLTNLTTLYLGNNNIGVQGATAIANRLTNLTTLDLSSNNIGDQGATAIANRLTNLTTLYLDNNNINESTKKSIRQRLKHIILQI